MATWVRLRHRSSRPPAAGTGSPGGGNFAKPSAPTSSMRSAVGGDTSVMSVAGGDGTADARVPSSEVGPSGAGRTTMSPATSVSYTHLRAHETVLDLVCRLLLEKKK